jgi:hypothetical protein
MFFSGLYWGAPAWSAFSCLDPAVPKTSGSPVIETLLVVVFHENFRVADYISGKMIFVK